MKPLTPRQADVLTFLKAFLVQHHRQPTYREVGAAFGIRSAHGVRCHIYALHRAGRLELIEHDQRDAHLRRDGWSQVRWRLVGVRVSLEDERTP